jgi:pimeloyl-ACP methyl ester carboxylesterase
MAYRLGPQICAAREPASFPTFLPNDLCQEFEDLDIVRLLKSYKQDDVHVPSLGSITTGFIGPSLILDETAEGAPPFLLLHGFDSNALEWRRIFGTLSKHARTYAIDLLGYGTLALCVFHAWSVGGPRRPNWSQLL